MSDVKKRGFTCDICRDLIPLVKDGVASADSENAVKDHLKSCPVCSKDPEFASVFDEEIDLKLHERSNKALIRLRKWLTLMYSVILLFGLYIALSLSGSRSVGISMLIMPFAGIFAYLAFRKKALFILPTVIVPMQWLINDYVHLQTDQYLRSDEFWRLIAAYYLLAVAGIVIMTLLRFAFGKIDLDKKGKDDEN